MSQLTKTKITVEATGSDYFNLTKMYAYNGDFGIETSYDNQSQWINCVEIEVKIGHMYPGTIEEWDSHIKACIVDELKEANLTHTTDYGTYLK